MLSIIVPIYNTEKYLNRCIDSILNQTYKDFELILVDDGSTDNSLNICDDYKKKDTRIKVLHKENGGLSSARNYGLDNAIGNYVTFVDSDDFVDINTYNNCVKELNKKGYDIIVFGVEQFNEKGEKIESNCVKSSERIILEHEDTMLTIIGKKSMGNYAWNKIYNKKLFENIRFPNNSLFEDVGTIYKVFDRADSVLILPNCYYYYIRRDGSITRQKEFDDRIYDFVKFSLEKYEFILEKYDKFSQEAIKELVLSILIVSKRIIKQNIIKEKITILNNCRNIVIKYNNLINNNNYVSEEEKKQLSLFVEDYHKLANYYKKQKLINYFVNKYNAALENLLCIKYKIANKQK